MKRPDKYLKGIVALSLLTIALPFLTGCDPVIDGYTLRPVVITMPLIEGFDYYEEERQDLDPETGYLYERVLTNAWTEDDILDQARAQIGILLANRIEITDIHLLRVRLEATTGHFEHVKTGHLLYYPGYVAQGQPEVFDLGYSVAAPVFEETLTLMNAINGPSAPLDYLAMLRQNRENAPTIQLSLVVDEMGHVPLYIEWDIEITIRVYARMKR